MDKYSNKSDQKRKNIDVSSGSVIGSISTDRQLNVAGRDFVGRDTVSKISEVELVLLFQNILTKIDTMPNLDEFDRADLRAELGEIAEELRHKGAFADEAILFRRMRNINRLCSDISHIIFQTFMDPSTGFHLTFGKIEEKMKR
jgi:hypothetical protein